MILESTLTKYSYVAASPAMTVRALATHRVWLFYLILTQPSATRRWRSSPTVAACWSTPDTAPDRRLLPPPPSRPPAHPGLETRPYTHHHWDHVWGAGAWSATRSSGSSGRPGPSPTKPHRPLERRLPSRAGGGQRPAWGRASADDRHQPSATGFRQVPPRPSSICVQTLPEGVEVIDVGGRHAPDSTVVVVPDDGVLFIGDAIVLNHPRQAGDGNHLAVADGSPDRTQFGDIAWFIAAHYDPWTEAQVGRSSPLPMPPTRWKLSAASCSSPADVHAV